MVSSNRWTRTRNGEVVHADSEEHVALVTRTLGVDETTWSATLDRYAERATGSLSTDEKLSALAEAFRYATRFSLPLAQESGRCLVCGQGMRPIVARSTSSGPSLIYGRCESCGHGQLLSGSTPSPYLGQAYYQRRASDGSGYDDYAQERAYRETKGEQLVARLLEAGKAGSLLEVGSGYGFTLQAARARGLQVAGIDLNPDAGWAARELYGLETLQGTLGQTLDSAALPSAAWDVVLYQFVLEHIEDPRRELLQATRALSAGGRLVLVVPSMSSFELDVFGARYRSLRGDHLHLFSAQSLERLLGEAGLRLVGLESHCNLHLVRGFLQGAELDALYASGRGPDLTVTAQRPA